MAELQKLTKIVFRDNFSCQILFGMLHELQGKYHPLKYIELKEAKLLHVRPLNYLFSSLVNTKIQLEELVLEGRYGWEIQLKDKFFEVFMHYLKMGLFKKLKRLSVS